MKLIKYTLFLVGGVALASGFLLSRASHIPWVLRALSPDYVAAQSGLSALESLDTLTVDDSGFKEIASVLAGHLGYVRDGSSPEPVNRSSIDLISYSGSQGSFHTHLGILTKMPVDIRLENGQVLQLDLTLLREDIEGLKNLDFSFWGNLLFSLGFLLYVTEFAVNQWEARQRL